VAATSDESVSLAGNRLLSALPPALASEVVKEVEEVELTTRENLYESGARIEDVYFPLEAVMSLVADMADGGQVEVATVGSEGMVGVPVLLRSDEADYRVFAQIPGRALRLEAGRLLELAARSEDFTNRLYRYVQALMTQIARSAACNRAHSIDERAARWLLLTHDRVGRDEFPLTQEFLAQMLGVRRASGNTAASMLQRAGFITYSRGRMRVVDRTGLERAACECYGIIRREYERLVP
jgi:CRP-like cAMP-binding protein